MSVEKWLFQVVRTPKYRSDLGRVLVMLLVMGAGVFLMLGGPWLVSRTPLGEVYRSSYEWLPSAGWLRYGGSSYSPPSGPFLLLIAGIAALGFVVFIGGVHWFVQQGRVGRHAVSNMLGLVTLAGIMVSIYGLHLYYEETRGVEKLTVRLLP